MKLTAALLFFGLLGLWSQGLAGRGEGRPAKPEARSSQTAGTRKDTALVPRSTRDKRAIEVVGEDVLVHVDAEEIEKAR